MRTALLFSLAYAVLLVCTVQFLLDTESAVFTVAVQSLALPLAGLFWSMFELTTDEDHIGELVFFFLLWLSDSVPTYVTYVHLLRLSLSLCLYFVPLATLSSHHHLGTGNYRRTDLLGAGHANRGARSVPLRGRPSGGCGAQAAHARRGDIVMRVYLYDGGERARAAAHD